MIIIKIECVKGLISRGVQKEAEYWRFSVERLSKEQGDKIKYSIRQKYIKDGLEKNWMFLWEHFIDDSIVTDCHGWELICDFVGKLPFISLILKRITY